MKIAGLFCIQKEIGASAFREKISNREIPRKDVVISMANDGIAEVTGNRWTCKFYAGTEDRARLIVRCY